MIILKIYKINIFIILEETNKLQQNIYEMLSRLFFLPQYMCPNLHA